jgi:hypothetical protein
VRRATKVRQAPAFAVGRRSLFETKSIEGVDAVKTAPFPVVALLGALLCVPTAVFADGFGLPNLNPFQSKPKSTPKRVTPGMPVAKKKQQASSSYSLPKLPGLNFPRPSWTPSLPKPHMPATVKRMNQSTKQFFAKTADVLTSPWQSDPTPTRRSTRITNRMPPEPKESEGILTSWFSPKKKEPPKDTRPKRVSDWIGGDRPY